MAADTVGKQIPLAGQHRVDVGVLPHRAPLVVSAEGHVLDQVPLTAEAEPLQLLPEVEPLQFLPVGRGLSAPGLLRRL